MLFYIRTFGLPLLYSKGLQLHLTSKYYMIPESLIMK